jgi:hypothetical protein
MSRGDTAVSPNLLTLKDFFSNPQHMDQQDHKSHSPANTWSSMQELYGTVFPSKDDDVTPTLVSSVTTSSIFNFFSVFKVQFVIRLVLVICYIQ